ncbi:MAG: hypothetical protein WAU11_11800 [Ignavibacteriaceae bacterium]
MNITGEVILKARITKNIKDKEYKKLLDALPVGEEYGISKELMYKGWKLAAQYLEEKNYLTDAILCYNKARRIKPSVVVVFDKVVSLLDDFFSKSKNEFSVDDLVKLRGSIAILENFHSVNFPNQKKISERIPDLYLKIDYHINHHPKIAEETKATFQVQKIYNAITDDMSIPEVHQEFAKTLAGIIRREKAKDKKGKATRLEKKKNKK